MLTIIIPTYNEKGNLRELLNRIYNALHDINFEIIIVDDNSPDGTAEYALKLRKKYKAIKVLKRKRKLGISSAFLYGFLHSKGEYIILMDADLQHPPEKIIEIVKYLEKGYDIVIASRFLKDSKIYGLPFYRKVISLSIIRTIRALIPKIGVSDPLSGFFGIRREVLEKVYKKIKFKRGFKILIEILANSDKLKVKEIPFEFYKREYGKSKVDSIVVIEILKQLYFYSEFTRLAKFMIVGLIGAIINLSSLYLLRKINVKHFIASAIAIEISILANFFLNNYWTFKDRNFEKVLNKLVKYHIVTAFSSTVQYLTSNFIYYLIIKNSILAQLIGIVMGFFINLIGSFKIVWRSKAK